MRKNFTVTMTALFLKLLLYRAPGPARVTASVGGL